MVKNIKHKDMCVKYKTLNWMENVYFVGRHGFNDSNLKQRW